MAARKQSLPLFHAPEEESASCASLLRVLADETRLAVVEGLLQGPRCVSEINEGLGVEPSLLSHHLRVLRDAGIVNAKRQGKQVFYELTRQVQGRKQGQAIDLGCCMITFD